MDGPGCELEELDSVLVGTAVDGPGCELEEPDALDGEFGGAGVERGGTAGVLALSGDFGLLVGGLRFFRRMERNFFPGIA